MANNNINVNLSFTADTSNAQAQLQNLQTSLKNITNSTNLGGKLGITTQIQEGIQAATELQVHLQKATNVNTGNLDFSKLNQSLKQSGMTLEQYGQQLMKLGLQGQQAFQQLAQSVAQSEIPLRRTSTLLAKLGTTLANTARWQLSSSLLMGFVSSIRNAFNYAEDLNESLNNIRIVTGYSVDEMAKFADQANKAAKALATTTTAYTDASLIFYQQGLKGADVLQRTDVVVKMANVTKQTVEETADQMTAIWNNFYDGTKSLEYYADVLTKLGAKTASSSDEIAGGLEKFAAIGETVGLSYEYAASALATITAQTRQSEDVVGTALKTIFGRMQGLKLGETLEDDVDLNKYTEALASVGVQVLDENKQLREMDDILDDLGERWGELSKAQQTATAYTVGGMRQYNQLIALMDNWDFMQENVSTAMGSTGELNKQQEIYADSWDAATKRVKASFEDMISKFIDDEFIIDIIDGFGKFVEIINTLIDSMGGFKGLLMGIGVLLTSLYSNQIANGIANMTHSLMLLTTAGQNALATQRKNFMESAAKQANPNGDTSGVGAAREQALRREVALQDTLRQNAASMNDVELEASKIALDRQRTLEQENIKIQEQLQLLQERNNISSFDLKGHMLSGSVGTEDEVYYENQVNMGMQKLDTALMVEKDAAMLQSAPNFNYAESEQQVQNILNYLKEIGLMDDEAAEGLKQDLIEGGEAADRALNKISMLTKKGTNNAANDLKAINDEIYAGEEFTQEREEGNRLIDDNVKNRRAAIQLEKEGIKVQKEANDSFENTNKLLAQGGKGIKHWSQGFVDASRTAMSLGMALSSITSAWNTIKDPDMSGWQKFTSILTSLGMAIPMFASSISTMYGAYKKLVPVVAARITSMLTESKVLTGLTSLEKASLSTLSSYHIAKKTGLSIDQAEIALSTLKNENIIKEIALNKTATEAEKIQQIIDRTGMTQDQAKIMISKLSSGATTKEALATALKTKEDKKGLAATLANIKAKIAELAVSAPLLVVTLAMVAALGALVAIIYFAIKGIQSLVNWINADKIALENLTTQVEDATVAYENAKKAVEEFKDTSSNYNSAVDALKDLTQETTEFSSKILEANDYALNLIEKFNLLRDKDFYVDAKGLIHIDKNSLNQVEKELIARQSSQAFALSNKKVALEQENLRQNKSKAIHSIATTDGEIDETSQYLEFYNSLKNSEDKAKFKEQLRKDLEKNATINLTVQSEFEKEKAISELEAKILKGTQELDKLDATAQGQIDALKSNTSALLKQQHEDLVEKYGYVATAGAKNLAFQNFEYFGGKGVIDYYKLILDEKGNNIEHFTEQDKEILTEVFRSALKLEEDESISNGEIKTDVENGVEGFRISKDKNNSAGKFYSYDEFANMIGSYLMTPDMLSQEMQKILQDPTMRSKAITEGYKSGYGAGDDLFTYNEDDYRHGLTESQVQELYNKLNIDLGAKNKQLVNDIAKMQEDIYFSYDKYKNTIPETLTNFMSKDLITQDEYDQLITELQAGGESATNALNKMFELANNNIDNFTMDENSKAVQDMLKKPANTSLERYELVDEILKMSQKDIEKAGGIQPALKQAEKEAAYTTYAAEASMDKDAFKVLAKEVEKSNTQLKGNAKAIAQVTAEQAKLDTSAAKLNETYDDLSESLDNSKKGTKEYAEAQAKLATAINDTLGTDIDAEFMAKDDNTELVKKVMTNRNTDDIIELQNKAQEDYIVDLGIEKGSEQYNAIMQAFDDMVVDINGKLTDVDDIKIGTTLDEAGLTETYQKLLDNGILTATQLEQMMQIDGWNIEFQRVKSKSIIYDEEGKAWYTDPEGNIQELPTGAEMTADAEWVIPVIKGDSIKVRDAKSISNSLSNTSKSSSNNKNQKISKKRDLVDRYKPIQDKLDKQKTILEDIADLDDRLYGEDKLQNYDRKLKALEKENRLLEEKRTLNKKYLQEDYDALTKFAQSKGIELKFDSDGTLLNQEAIQSKLADQIIKDEKAGVEDSKAKETLEEFNELFENYKETQEEGLDNLEAIIENMYSRIEVINEKHEAKLEMLNKDSEKIQKKYDKSFGADKLRGGEAYRQSISEQVDYINNSWLPDLYNQRSNKINELKAKGIKFDDKFQAINEDQIYAEYEKRIAAASGAQKAKLEEEYKLVQATLGAVGQLNQDVESAFEQKDELYEEFEQSKWDDFDYKVELKGIITDLEIQKIDLKEVFINEDAFSEKITLGLERQLVNDQQLKDAMDTYNELMSIPEGQRTADWYDRAKEAAQAASEAIIENQQALLETFETYKETYSEIHDMAMEAIDDYGRTAETLEHYQNLVEALGKETDYKAIEAIQKASLNNTKEKLKTLTKYLNEVLLPQRDQLAQQIASGMYTGDALKKAEEELKVLNDLVAETSSEINSTLEESVETANQILENGLNKAIASFEEAITGGFSLEELTENIERLTKKQEEYLTKTNQLYETNKMIRQAQLDMDKTDSLMAKQRYQAYIKEVEQLAAAGKMSQQDLKIAQARYELLQAQIALEEAQKAKDSMRLVRGADGNWDYVYTADQNKIADAEGKVADAENSLYNLGLEGAQEYRDKIIELDQEFAEKTREINEKYKNDEEARQKALDELLQHHLIVRQGLEEEYHKAYNLLVSESATGYADYMLGQITSTEEFEKEALEMYNNIDIAVEEWQENTIDANDKVSDGYGGLYDAIGDVYDQTANISNQINNTLIPDLADEATAVRNAAKEWLNLYNNAKLANQERAKEITEGLTSLQNAESKQFNNNNENNNKETSTTDWSQEMLKAAINDDNQALKNAFEKRAEKEKETGKNYGYTSAQLYNILTGLERIGFNLSLLKGKSISEWAKWAIYHGIQFASGGYTGAWGPEGKFAMLHQKELVLNAEDTANMLAAVDIVRQLSRDLDLRVGAYKNALGQLDARVNPKSATTSLQQDVTIHANFPNVSSREEIEAAFDNLINEAVQYVNMG